MILKCSVKVGAISFKPNENGLEFGSNREVNVGTTNIPNRKENILDKGNEMLI
jgi:hypothetical protein